MAIQVKITAGLNAETSSVQASGNVMHVITDVERNTFNVQDENLKNLVNAYFGKRPNDAYVCSPTPWGDLYKSYNWSQVQVNLVVQSASILGITSEPQIIDSKRWNNNTSKTMTCDVSMTQSVTNTSESNWNSSDKITVGQSINYSLEFPGAGSVGGETSLSYEHSWGQGGSVSQEVTVGSTASSSVTIDPGESLIAELSASKGVMKVRIVYNAYLTGQVAVNYNPKYKDHHFFALGIDNLLMAGNISNSVQVVEDISIGFFANGEINSRDISGNRSLVYTPSVQAA